MDAVKTPGQECSALLQGLLLCHMQGLQGGNGMDTTLVLTDSQTRREGKHGRGDRSVSADAKEQAECSVDLSRGVREGFLLYVYPEAQAGAEWGGRALPLREESLGVLSSEQSTKVEGVGLKSSSLRTC